MGRREHADEGTETSHRISSATRRLHDLKLNDAHFRTLADRYHDLLGEITPIEDGTAPASDERLEDLKKQRLALLDQIGALIAAEPA